MARTEDRHWWWQGRRAVLDGVLDDLYADPNFPRGTLFDLGCGVGGNLPLLARRGHALGFDGSPLAVDAAHRLGRTDVTLADLEKGVSSIPAEHHARGAVVLLADVLEHLDDEAPALQLAHELLLPGGAVVITVPALPALWSASDDYNHHRRRYTRTTLAAAVSRRFEIARLTYFNSFLLPPIAAARALAKLTGRSGKDETDMPSPVVNRVLEAVFSSESSVLRRTNLPLGVSLLCVGRKRLGP